MSGIAWSDSYKLGNEKVDSQHRKLFQLLSGLVDSCEDGSNLEKVKEALDFLVNYTVHHFDDEEELQLACGFPEYENHKKIHEAFKVTVGELVSKFNESGSSEELSTAISKIVVKWLVRHIQGEDKKISAYL